MSFESVLLLLFLVFPLLERLIRFLRARAGQPTAEPVPDTQERRAPLPRPTAPEVLAAPAERPAEAGRQAPPPLPLPPRHPAVERLSASDRVRAARLLQTEVAAPPNTPRTRPRAHIGMTRLGGRADLRRAVVLMTVLGPCKALENEPGRR